MRRSRQQIGESEALQMLDQATSGVLSLVDPEGLPYGVPLSFVREDDHLYFHCALEGRKLQCVQSHPAGSFCVISADDILPEKFTTSYLSVMAAGPLCQVADEEEKRRVLYLLTEKYCGSVPFSQHQAEVEGSINRTVVLRLDIQSVTGKGGKERMMNRFGKENRE